MNLSDLQKQLLVLLSDGNFHSGRELAEILSSTRAVIWKQIKGFKRLGIDVAAISGKGYRLPYPMELLDETCITRNLAHEVKALLSILHIHYEIDSTSNYLINDATATSGTVCLAEFQTAGRGRAGRDWISPFGTNIYLSLLWRFESGVASISGLSLAIGVAVMRALNRYRVAGIGLKWPNDIFYNDRKLGGILVEVRGDILGPCTVVVGLGLNGQVPSGAGSLISQPWVDLEQILGSARPERNVLVAQLLNEIFPIISKFDEIGIEAYLPEWRDWDCMAGREVSLTLGSQKIRGRVEGIDDQGMIILQTGIESRQSFASGEVSLHIDRPHEPIA